MPPVHDRVHSEFASNEVASCDMFNSHHTVVTYFHTDRDSSLMMALPSFWPFEKRYFTSAPTANVNRMRVTEQVDDLVYDNDRNCEAGHTAQSVTCHVAAQIRIDLILEEQALSAPRSTAVSAQFNPSAIIGGLLSFRRDRSSKPAAGKPITVNVINK